jgi:GAF domain-containing protein
MTDLVDAVLDVAGQSRAPEALRITVEKAMDLTDARQGTLGAPLHDLSTSVLGTSIASGAKVHARFVLTDKPEGAPFTERDEATVAALARAAAIALEHACETGRENLARRRLEIVAETAR